jgi:hypothetical protein
VLQGGWRGEPYASSARVRRHSSKIYSNAMV